MKRMILGTVTVVAGVLLALQPLDWIELHYGIDADAGNGVLETMVSAALIAVGAVLVGSAWLSRNVIAHLRRRRDRVAGATPGSGQQSAAWEK